MNYHNQDPRKFDRAKSPMFDAGDFAPPTYHDRPWAAPAHMQHLLPSQIENAIVYYPHAFCLWESNEIHAHRYQGGRLILMGVN